MLDGSAMYPSSDIDVCMTTFPMAVPISAAR
jgi:hypothetical protein